MTGRGLLIIYEQLRDLGIARSKRDFAVRILDRGKTFVRDFEHREGRDSVPVPMSTIEKLRRQFRALADRMPSGLRADIEVILQTIDRDVAVTNLLARHG